MSQSDDRRGAVARSLPGLGYALSLVICAIGERWFVGRWGRTGYELAWFVLAPGLFGLAHVMARGRVRGGRGYDLLGAAWVAAALLGLAAHWRALGPVAPFVSLARYALVALTGLLFCVSVMLGRPLFVGGDVRGPVLACGALGLLGAAMLAAWLSAVGVVVGFTPWPVALAPAEPGAKYERVWVSEGEHYLAWISWSPDGRHLLGQGRGVWLLQADGKNASLVHPYGMIACDRPWNAKGDGFLFARTGGSELGIWSASLATKTFRKIRDGQVGVPSCSPDGTAVAFDAREGLCVANTDGSGGRTIAELGEVPRWSPDGEHLLTTRAARGDDRYWVVSLDGKAWRVPAAAAALDEVAWVGEDAFATIEVKTSRRLPFLPERQTAAVWVWDVKGRRIAKHRLGSYLGGAECSLAVTRDGRRLAVATDMVLPFGDSLAALDVKTGELRRLPASVTGAGGMAWSPDGSLLALSGIEEVSHEETYSYVAVISGCKTSAEPR